MTNSEKAKLLAGYKNDRITLFTLFTDKMSAGEVLEESEIVMLEFLKKDLINPDGTISGNMSASLEGVGGVAG